MQKLQYLGLIICTAFVLSCETREEDDLPELEISEQLIGDWTKTMNVGPKGSIISSIKISSDATFEYKIDVYVINTDLLPDEISFWSESSGNVEQNEDKLIFTSMKNTWFDVQSDESPKSDEVSRIVFEDCSYKIVGDTLFLSYTTYPADAPITSTFEFFRLGFRTGL